MGTHSYIFVCSLETDYLVFNFEFGQLMTFFIIYETQLQLSNFTPNIETFNLCTMHLQLHVVIVHVLLNWCCIHNGLNSSDYFYVDLIVTTGQVVFRDWDQLSTVYRTWATGYVNYASDAAPKSALCFVVKWVLSVHMSSNSLYTASSRDTGHQLLCSRLVSQGVRKAWEMVTSLKPSCFL